MADVKFEDYSIEVKGALNRAVLSALEEVAGELESQVKRLMDKLPGQWYVQQKNAWEHHVDESKGEAVIGNPMEAMLWTEFGTGEYAVNGDGRKGYWVYVADGKEPPTDYEYKGGKQYTKEEAKKIVAMMRADGLDAYYTKGQTPKRPFETAFNTNKEKLKQVIENVMRGLDSES